MNIRYSVLSLLLATAAPVLAEDSIPYVPMSLCEAKPYASVRDAWHSTGIFCFESKNHRYTYPISALREVDLRKDGHWAANEYVEALSEESRAIADEYSKYSIRYLALDDGTKGLARPFVTQVVYNWAGATMTTYVFGEIDPTGQVHLTGFSDGGAGDGAVRSAVHLVKNFFSLFAMKNPNREGVNESKTKDRRRIKPVRDVVNHYVKAAPILPKP